ncbi:MAG: ribonuclease Z [Clostridiales bacterium]|nr:ribonuclease Z [Clostridiales bacterium]
MLDVCLPGTGGVIPLVNRWLSCCWIEYQGKALLIDCGEGTQIALKKAGCRYSHLEVLLLTHFHADHVAGLPGLMLTLSNNGKTSPLVIVGPAGLNKVVSSLTVIAPILQYPIHLIELRENLPGFLDQHSLLVDTFDKHSLDHDELRVSYLPLNHNIPCFGYMVTVKRKPVFNPQKASDLGVPQVLYKQLHAGTPLLLEDGRSITPDMVLDGSRPPVKVCYCTDTKPVAAMADFARGSDLFICEGMYDDFGMQEKMAQRGHMIFSDSARIARDAGVGQLWLTHFSPALSEPEKYVGNAREIFPNTLTAYDGIRITV